jgi:hypothetical protein
MSCDNPKKTPSVHGENNPSDDHREASYLVVSTLVRAWVDEPCCTEV